MTFVKIAKWAIIVSIAAVVALVALVFAVIIAFPAVLNGPTAAPLQLPPLNTAIAGVSRAPADGLWVVGPDSLAGFRVEESFLSQHGTIVGRTSAVTGSLAISHGQIVSGSFQVDLSQLTLGGKPNPNFFKMMSTTQYPQATLALTNPIVFANNPAAGQTVSSNATGTLTMRGVTHPVTFGFIGRYDASVLEATGTVPFLASDWGVQSPFGIHDQDEIEFLVILRQAIHPAQGARWSLPTTSDRIH